MPDSPQRDIPKSTHRITYITAIVVIVLAGSWVWWNMRAVPSVNPINYTTTTGTPSPTTGSITGFTITTPGVKILTGGFADASVVPITGGYRMYVNTFGKVPSGYLIYKSTDGATWTKEKDIVIPGVATGRAVLLPDGVRFYYPGVQPIKDTDPPADIYSSFSTDGLTFTKESGVRISPRSGYFAEGPTVFKLPDGTWRMYFNEGSIASGNRREGGIWGASSTDGLTWKRDPAITLEADALIEKISSTSWPQALHPMVVAKPTGGWLMFYNTHSEVYAAESTDGLAWKKIGAVGIHGADVDAFYQADGSLRVYYGDYDPATGGLIYTAVITPKTN